MVQYRFVTQWFFRIPTEQVWERIVDEESWGEWLQNFRRIAVCHSPTSGEKLFDIQYRGDLPYSFHFTLTPTCVGAPRRLELIARGELEGTGCWTLTKKGNGTGVTYIWEVA